MIKLKDILLENTAPNIFIPRRIEGRVERMIKTYIRNGNKGKLSLQDLNLTVLPEMLKDITVNGDFFCGNNHLTTLENCPKTVGGDFLCSVNKLTSLINAPSSVGGDFYCSYNLLTSLEGAPETVGGDFYCGYNSVQFTEAQVRAVCDVKGDVYV